MSEKIQLTHNEDDSTYTDDGGAAWCYAVIDHMAEQEDGECRICGAVLDYDLYLCLDDGSFEVCTDCVEIQSEKDLEHGRV